MFIATANSLATRHSQDNAWPHCLKRCYTPSCIECVFLSMGVCIHATHGSRTYSKQE